MPVIRYGPDADPSQFTLNACAIAGQFTMNPPDYSTTSLDLITVPKQTLLEKLRENRQTHKEIFDAACEGFWLQAKEKLERRNDQFKVAQGNATTEFDVKYAEFKGAIETKNRDGLQSFPHGYGGKWQLDFKTDWVPSYPVNYLEDYDRAISMLEFSVADKVTLTVNDFDAYARNNWKWKETFSKGNLDLVKCMTGAAVTAIGNGFLSSRVYSYAANDGRI